MPVTYGAFTSDTADALLAQASALQTVQPTLYVNSYTGSNTYNGRSPATAYATIAQAVAAANNGEVIGIFGVFRENVTARLGLQDVTIIGQGSQVPRQATSGGVANGGGATWLSPTTVTNTADLLVIKGQGWTIQNVYFNNSATGAADVLLLRSGTGDPPADPDASHANFVNCRFTGANIGIEDEGGCAFVHIDQCEFFNFAGASDCAIKNTSASIAAPLRWVITNSAFWGNVDHIIAPANKWTIKGCTFDGAATVTIDFTGGTAPNIVQQNAFAITAANFDPAGGVTGVSGDAWSNYLIDAVETGLPAN